MRKYSASPLVVHAPRFHERLGEHMRAVGLGVRELAAVSGVDKGTISAWHSGKQTRVQVEKVRRIAGALGATAEELLDMAPSGERPAATQPFSPRQGVVLARLEQALPALRALVEDAEKA